MRTVCSSGVPAAGSEPVLTVYLARHGQTEENLARVFQGQLPGQLTDEGRRQAVELGRQLREVRIDAVVSSDLQRVTDTVRLAVGDRRLPWEQSSLFREADWGSWTGLPFDGVDRSCPPADAETPRQLYERAGQCVAYLRRQYAGRTVLVVSHGLVGRSIEAWLRGVPMDALRSVPFLQNAEVRRFRVT